ncbi:hypothetical protein GIS00_02500 [Nakamurella sp. YIM 132087]|uniref:Lipoprotein n=1 Tax=Nakamurella alba TaxID=2665158 RepID=A0A7K1FFB9_9ACTN|nr:hypothetical protein [Nakamurella alba]MTD12815.1 hypothetical protein [Nakamurella alba]
MDRSRWFAAAMTAALLLAGCSRSTAADDSSAVVFDFQGDVQQREEWDGGAVVVVPPPADADPDVDVDLAMRTCVTGKSVCGASSGLVVRIGVATTHGAGTYSSTESIPLMKDRLVYEVISPGFNCLPAGAAQDDGPYTCSSVAWIDAATGDNIYGLSGPGIGPTH